MKIDEDQPWRVMARVRPDGLVDLLVSDVALRGRDVIIRSGTVQRRPHSTPPCHGRSVANAARRRKSDRRSCLAPSALPAPRTATASAISAPAGCAGTQGPHALAGSDRRAPSGGTDSFTRATSNLRQSFIALVRTKICDWLEGSLDAHSAGDHERGQRPIRETGPLPGHRSRPPSARSGRRIRPWTSMRASRSRLALRTRVRRQEVGSMDVWRSVR